MFCEVKAQLNFSRDVSNTLEQFSTQATGAFQSYLGTKSHETTVFCFLIQSSHLWLYNMKQEMALKSREATEDVERILDAIRKPAE